MLPTGMLSRQSFYLLDLGSEHRLYAKGVVVLIVICVRTPLGVADHPLILKVKKGRWANEEYLPETLRTRENSMYPRTSSDEICCMRNSRPVFASAPSLRLVEPIVYTG